MAEDEAQKIGEGSAAELLSSWRAAERDRVAAEDTAGVAGLAAAASAEASKAATETADAARLSLEASQRAELAARRTSDAANLASAAARRDVRDSDAALTDARERESAARDAFQSAQERGFPKSRES